MSTVRIQTGPNLEEIISVTIDSDLFDEYCKGFDDEESARDSIKLRMRKFEILCAYDAKNYVIKAVSKYT